MGKNIWGEDLLDSKDPNDPYSVISREAVWGNVLGNEGDSGNTDSLEGGYYYKVDGEYLGKEGKSQNVFLAERAVKDKYDSNNKKVGEEVSFINKKQLAVNHYDLTYCAGVILKEGKDYEELLFIAHTANNEANFNSKSLQQTLSSSYSTVPKAQKKPLIDKLDSQAKNQAEQKQLALEKSARRAIIDVYNGGTDVSNGSQRWDGVDFIAWGLYHAPKEVSKNFRHSKFNQYGTINISKEIFDKYKTNCGSQVSYKSKGWENPKVPGSFVFDIPEEVFLDVNNWSNNEFSYSTKVNKQTLVATAIRGKTIYWKIIR